MAFPTSVSSNAILTASKSQEGAAEDSLSTSEGELATGLWKHFGMPHLELKNLTQRFGSQTALDGLNLSVGKGELICLLGPSGCGKTTTIRLIAGFLEPSCGSVWIDGRDVTPLPPEQRNIGMVFQSYALFPHLNVFENVAFGLKAAKVPRPQIESRVQRALELVNLPSYGKRPVFELSGGEQQRVAIARALANHPKIILADEPTGDLDTKTGTEVVQIMYEAAKKENASVLVITHDPVVAGRAEKLFEMRDGIITKGSQQGPREAYRLRAIEPVPPEPARSLSQPN